MRKVFHLLLPIMVAFFFAAMVVKQLGKIDEAKELNIQFYKDCMYLFMLMFGWIGSYLAWRIDDLIYEIKEKDKHDLPR